MRVTLTAEGNGITVEVTLEQEDPPEIVSVMGQRDPITTEPVARMIQSAARAAVAAQP